MPARGKDTYCIQSVENALLLLETLCDEGDEVSLTRLSERLDMKKASLFRLLATFENHGYVEREPESRKYRLGISAYELAQKFLSRMALLRKARSVMDHLAREYNEATYLILKRGEEVLFLDLVDCTHQVKVVSLVGKRFPLDTSAPGKVFLAYSTSAPCPGRANGRALPPPLSDELETIRGAGVCVDYQGIVEGTTCLAVPLFNGAEEVAGVLAILGPDYRMPRERVAGTLIPALKSAAGIISSRMGYLGHLLATADAGNGPPQEAGGDDGRTFSLSPDHGLRL